LLKQKIYLTKKGKGIERKTRRIKRAKRKRKVAGEAVISITSRNSNTRRK